MKLVIASDKLKKVIEKILEKEDIPLDDVKMVLVLDKGTSIDDPNTTSDPVFFSRDD